MRRWSYLRRRETRTSSVGIQVPSPAGDPRCAAHEYRSFSLLLPSRHEGSWLGNSNRLSSVNRSWSGLGSTAGSYAAGSLRGLPRRRPSGAQSRRRWLSGGPADPSTALPPLLQAYAGPHGSSRSLRAPAFLHPTRSAQGSRARSIAKAGARSRTPSVRGRGASAYGGVHIRPCYTAAIARPEAHLCERPRSSP